MKLRNHNNRNRHGLWLVAAVVPLFLVLGLLALAASPKLHELVHNDADSAGHQCAVTLFTHGQVDVATVTVAPVLPPALIGFVAADSFSNFSPCIAHLPAGRAPPVLPAVS